MARSLGTKGREELASFRARVVRQMQLGRINHSDANKLLHMVNELDAQVVRTSEKDQPGKESNSVF